MGNIGSCQRVSIKDVQVGIVTMLQIRTEEPPAAFVKEECGVNARVVSYERCNFRSMIGKRLTTIEANLAALSAFGQTVDTTLVLKNLEK